jgi:WhiB family redox-sensing transcriptional regulator
VIEPEAWRYDAACIGHPPELFIEPETPTAVARAKHICATCPVAAACLTAGLHEGVQVGIRGGLTVEERTGRRPECGTNAGYYAHRRRREARCQLCLDAHNEQMLANVRRKTEVTA